MTIIPIKGEVEGIERNSGRTDVLVDEGINVVTYTLDEALIDFQSAVEELVRSTQREVSKPGQLYSALHPPPSVSLS